MFTAAVLLQVDAAYLQNSRKRFGAASKPGQAHKYVLLDDMKEMKILAGGKDHQPVYKKQRAVGGLGAWGRPAVAAGDAAPLQAGKIFAAEMQRRYACVDIRCCCSTAPCAVAQLSFVCMLDVAVGACLLVAVMSVSADVCTAVYFKLPASTPRGCLLAYLLAYVCLCSLTYCQERTATAEVVRKVRMSKDELEAELFKKFAEQPHWHFVQLSVRRAR
jgi:hypothetical protein